MTVYYLCEPCSLTHDNNMSFPVRTLNDGHRSGSTMYIVRYAHREASASDYGNIERFVFQDTIGLTNGMAVRGPVTRVLLLEYWVVSLSRYSPERRSAGAKKITFCG